MKVIKQGKLTKEKGYTRVPNSIFNEDLSANEKLLLVYLLRHRSGFNITKSHISKALKCARSTVYNLLDSLQKKRFIQLDTNNDLVINEDLSQFEVSNGDTVTSNETTLEDSSHTTPMSNDDTHSSTETTQNVQPLDAYNSNKTNDKINNKTSENLSIEKSSISSNQMKETNNDLVNEINTISQLPLNYQKEYYFFLTTFLQTNSPIEYEERRYENNCKMELERFRSNLKSSAIPMDLNGQYNQPEIKTIDELTSTKMKEMVFYEVKKDYIKHLNNQHLN